MDPYILFNMTPDADDETVKSAYIRATQAYPPDKSPQMFKMIRTAFESISNQRQRLNHQLFEVTPVCPQTIIYACLQKESKEMAASSQLNKKNFKQGFKQGAESAILHNLERLL